MSMPARARRLLAFLRHSAAGRRLSAVAMLAAYCLLFVPTWPIFREVIGAFSYLLTLAVAFLLSPWETVLFALAGLAASTYLYSLFLPFSWGITAASGLIGLIVCGLGIAVRKIWDRFRAQQAALADANARLLDAQAALVQSAKLAAMGELAAGVGHEINQPLSIIGMAAEEAAATLKEGRPDAAKEALALIAKQVERAGAIIAHLKAMARRNDFGTAKVETDLAKVIRDSIEFATYPMKNHGVEVRLELAEPLPCVLCAPVMIEQVLTNLYLNAMDAMENRPSKVLTIRARKDNGSVRVEVADTGSGIAEGHLARVFDPFFTTKPVGRGTGLGLSVAHRIVMGHGGTISVASKADQGTTFTITLPYIRAAT